VDVANSYAVVLQKLRHDNIKTGQQNASRTSIVLCHENLYFLAICWLAFALPYEGLCAAHGGHFDAYFFRIQDAFNDVKGR